MSGEVDASGYSIPRNETRSLSLMSLLRVNSETRPAQIDEIANSISSSDSIPLLIDKDNVVIDGNRGCQQH
jgi:hypothetical protein